MSDAEREFLNRYASCRIEPVRRYIGDRLDEALLSRIEQESGASTVRVIGPGTDMSMEGIAGRLSVTIDSDRRVVNFGCE